MMRTMGGLGALVVLALGSAAGCQTEKKARSAEQSMAELGGALSDGQISQVMVAVGDGEIATSRLAEQKAQSPELRSFAETMIREHTDINREMGMVATRVGFAPTSSNLSDTMQKDARMNEERLAEKTGGDFDRAYLDCVIRDHEKLLKTVDERLMPAAASRDLQVALQKARPRIVSHLEQARVLRKGL